MTEQSVRSLVAGDRITNINGQPDVVRSVEVVVNLASGISTTYATPSNVELLPPEEIPEPEMQRINRADASQLEPKTSD
jgi:hypothetical protein